MTFNTHKICVLFLFFVNCNSKDSVVLDSNSNKIKTQSQFDYKIQEHPFLQFRRNYSYDEATYENEKLRNQLDERNPELIGSEIENETYLNGFKTLGLLDAENTFDYKKWNQIAVNQTWKTIPIQNSKINIKNEMAFLSISYDENAGYDFLLKNKGNKSLAKNNFKFGFPPDVTFLITDLDKDKQDEIIALFCWYIVNGHNYDFTIYEIVKN